MSFSNNPLLEYHSLVEKYPNRFSNEIKQVVKIQRDMLQAYDFVPEKADRVIVFIERYCILTEGENAGQRVSLMLWQKWFIYSIFAFWGYYIEDDFDDAGNIVGRKKKYLRVVKDILMVIASGNSKTTFMSFINTYLLLTKDYPAAKIYIGSNAQKQSILCFNSTLEIINKNEKLKKRARMTPSNNTIKSKDDNSLLMAMSSDGKSFEGIIPTNIMIDETHEMKTSTYANNLRKSVKRDDSFVFETTTMGTVRGGYLDERLEYAKKVLDGDVVNHRFFCCIFKQDSEDEVIRAYKDDNMSILLKSNPSLGHAVSLTMLKGKIKDLIDNPSQKSDIFTKNFNIPQNPITCYFSERECRTKSFDESIFNQAPVFFGLDMAFTRSPENDLACLTMMTKNPITEEEYFKDFYFLPKYWERQEILGEGISVEKKDMIKYKSKYDTNIDYDEKNKEYGYQKYADRGDLIIIDEALVDTLAEMFGEEVRYDCDCTGVTQKFIPYYMAYLERIYGFVTCKVGLDPNKANAIESFINANVASLDGMPPAVKFQMERTSISNPIMEDTKDIRARELVYCNNKLTELHFFHTESKIRPDGTIILDNSQRARKDGVIAHLSARSAYNVFTSHNKQGSYRTGEQNKQLLIQYWSDRNDRLAEEASKLERVEASESASD